MVPRFKIGWFFTLLLLIFSCAREYNPLSVQDGMWVSDIPYYVPLFDITVSHDNRIYETDHFLTFSNGSSDEVKVRFATYAEQGFADLLKKFAISNGAELGIAGQSTKIIIFTNKILPELTQRVFPFGFVLYSEDSDIFATWPEWLTSRYSNMIKHETMHVLQYLLGTKEDYLTRDQIPEFWFTEGLAEFVCDGTSIPVTTLNEFNEWFQNPDHINPVRIHHLSDSPVSMMRIYEYYAMFGLAVRYLLDDNGHGKTLLDVKDMFATIQTGNYLFTEAFAMHMDITIEEFEEVFLDSLPAYLSGQ